MKTNLASKPSDDLPSDWRLVRLGEVSALNPRRPPLERKDEEPTSFVPMPAVDSYHGTISTPETRPYKDVRKGYTYFEDGDVLFAKITPCMENGKSAVAHGLKGGVGFGSTEFHVIRPEPEVLPTWIHLYVRQPRVLDEAKNHFTGAVGQQRVPASFLSDLEIPLPPLPEQRRISSLLKKQFEAVEKARAAVLAQIEDAQSLAAAFLRHAFPKTGDVLPKGWRWVELREIATIHPGQHIMASEYGTDGIGIGYLTGPADFGETVPTISKWTKKPKTFSEPGDVLVTVKGAGVGKSNLAPPERVAIGRQLMAIRPVDGTSETDFLFYFIRAKMLEISGQALGATVPGLGRDSLERLNVPLPRLPEQKRIASLLKKQFEAVERESKVAQAQLDEIEALPASMLRQAFNGAL